MKRVKANKEKIADLQKKIGEHCAHLSHETPLYGEKTADQVTEWIQSAQDCVQENIRLLVCIARTNLATEATIDLGADGQRRPVTKTLAEWVWRRREYAAIDLATWARLTDRNLREGKMQSSTEVPIEVKIVRSYNPERRDKKLAEYKAEPHEIDAALEVINAITDLIEE